MSVAENTRFSLLLQRVFGVRGFMDADVQPMIVPTYPVADALAGEHALGRGEVMGDVAITQAGVAATQARVALVNTGASGRLVIVERVWVRAVTGTATVAICVGGEPTPLSTRFGVCADSRRAPVTATTFAAAYTSPATLPSAQQVCWRTATSTGFTDANVGPYVLAPGWALIVENQTIAGTMDGVFRFRERQVSGEELRERA